MATSKTLTAQRRSKLSRSVGAARSGRPSSSVKPLKGTVYPGNWDFVIRGIYDGAKKGTDQSQMFLHWAYLNETVRDR